MSKPSAGSAAAKSRPGDIWTAGGILFAPRYLDNPGDFEFGLGPTYLLQSTPSAPASPIAGAIGIQWKMAESLELAALIAPVTLIGLRGPITESEYGSVGWALLFRSDLYPTGIASGSTFVDPPALPQGLNKVPLMAGAAMNAGGELRIDGMQKLGPINLYAVPRLAVMSNGTRVGLGLGLDLDFDRIVIGANWLPSLNITPPTTAAGVAAVNTFENQYGGGGRVVVTDNIYLVGSYVFVPADAYGNQVGSILAGIGYRFGGGGGMRRSR